MPSPFSGLLPILGCDASIISLSPERFISIDVNNTVTSQPIKGTAKRCDNPHDDKVASESLSNSDKCQSENLMIVDLIRNDLGKCCNIGSVTVEKLFELQSFSNVHHLVSTIKGTLRSGLNGADVLQACFPGGSITGAPKIRAMEIINEVENSRRDIYCGSLVVFSAHGTMDSNILIRTVLLQNGKAYCWAGGGIIADSECQSEYEESLTKVQVLLDAIQN
jgi:para-aminobenzoate synthetase component 1